MGDRDSGLVKYPYPNVVEVDPAALAAEAAAIPLPGEPDSRPAPLPRCQTTRELLWQLRDHFKIASDYALAKKLDVTQKTVKTWRSGRGGFSDAMAMRVENELGLPRGYVVASMHAERSISGSDVQKMWERLAGLARQAASGIALAAVGALAGLTAPAPSQAATAGAFDPSIHYANLPLGGSGASDLADYNTREPQPPPAFCMDCLAGHRASGQSQRQAAPARIVAPNVAAT